MRKTYVVRKAGERLDKIVTLHAAGLSIDQICRRFRPDKRFHLNPLRVKRIIERHGVEG